MKKKIELRDFFIIGILFLFNPFIGYLLAMYKVLSSDKNRKYLCYIYIYYGFFGLLFLNKSNMDITAHYEIFERISKQTNKQFIIFLFEQKDFLVFIYYKILSLITKNYRWIGFLSAMISYGIPFYLIIDFSQRNKLKKYEILIFLILFLSITPSYKFSGMRNFNAICLFSLGIYLVEVLKEKNGYIYMLLAPLIHISILVLIFIYLFSKRIKLTKIKIIISLFISIILLKFSKSFLLLSLKLFPEFSKFTKGYIDGEFATKITSDNIIVLMYYLFFFGIYAIFYTNILKDKKLIGLSYYNFLVFYFPIISIFSFSKTLYNRYAENIVILLILTLIYLYSKKIKQKICLYITISCFGILNYAILTKIEYKTWNLKIISSTTNGILKEVDYLRNNRNFKLKR